MLTFSIEPFVRFKEMLKIRFQHLPAEESILNGAYKVTGEETDDELNALALKSVLKLKEEYEKYGKINILLEEKIIDFSNFYSKLPTMSQENVKDLLIDLFGKEILKYIER